MSQLTKDQEAALSSIIEFALSKTHGQFMLLEGPAGVGKTYLMKLFVKHNNKLGSSRLRILGACATHKARKVLERNLNDAGMIMIPTKTIAALLKKQRLNSYLGHKKYGTGGNTMSDFDLIIVDECSMINDADLEKLIQSARLNKTKMLFCGDEAQIPNPTQRLIKLSPDMLVKADSACFKLKNRASLTQIVRQKEGNPVLEVSQHIRDNLFCTDLHGPYQHIDRLQVMKTKPLIRGCDADLSKLVDPTIGFPVKNRAVSQPQPQISQKVNSVAEKDTLVGVRFVSSIDFEKLIEQELLSWNRGEWRDPFEVRILSYTNESVRTYNRLARNARYSYIQEQIMPGELIMGYDNIGWPTPYIENGQDYLVVGARKVDNHPVILGPGPEGKVLAVGYLVTMGETMFDSMDVMPATVKTHFFPDINSDRNLPILHELLSRSKLVNQPNSSTKAFKHYHELKDQLIFMECLYEYRGRIYSESHFLREHPLLMTNVSELIKEEINSVNYPDISLGPNTDVTAPRVQIKGARVKNEDNPRPKGVRSIRQHFLYQQIAELYPNLVEERMMSYHMLGDSEKLADRFLFIEKDVDYAYAITCHKSQASTYNRVYVDDSDIAKIHDRWNYQHNAWYRASKERNQLKYVAVTRARHLVTILSMNTEHKSSDFDKDNIFGKEKEVDESEFITQLTESRTSPLSDAILTTPESKYENQMGQEDDDDTKETDYKAIANEYEY